MSNPVVEPDWHTMVDQLTRWQRHREPYAVRRGAELWNGGHVTLVPPLIAQLLGAAPAASGTESGSGAVSKPAARIEAVDTLLVIDKAAAALVRQLGEDDPGDELEVVRVVQGRTGPTCLRCVHASCAAIRRGDYVERRVIPGSGTIRCLQLLHGLYPGADRLDQKTIEASVKRWWRQARIITGWDSPAYRPFNTCPVCEHKGGLRVNLGIQCAFCVECRSTWSPVEIGLLAEHIREENAEDDESDTLEAAPA